MPEKKKVINCADFDMKEPGPYEFFGLDETLRWTLPVGHTAIHQKAVVVRYDCRTDQYFLSIQQVPRGTEC